MTEESATTQGNDGLPERSGEQSPVVLQIEGLLRDFESDLSPEGLLARCQQIGELVRSGGLEGDPSALTALADSLLRWYQGIVATGEPIPISCAYLIIEFLAGSVGGDFFRQPSLQACNMCLARSGILQETREKIFAIEQLLEDQFRVLTDVKSKHLESEYRAATAGQIGGRVASILEKQEPARARPRRKAQGIEHKCRALEALYRSLTWGDVLSDLEHEYKGQVNDRENRSPAQYFGEVIVRRGLTGVSIADSLPEIYMNSGENGDHDCTILINLLRESHLYQGIGSWIKKEIEGGETDQIVEALIVLFNTENQFQFIHPDVKQILDHLIEKYRNVVPDDLPSEARLKMEHFLQETFFAASTDTINDWGYARDVCAEFVHALHDPVVGPLLWRDCVDYCVNDRWLYPPFLFQLKIALALEFPDMPDTADLLALLKRFYEEDREGGLRAFMGTVNIIITANSRQFEIEEPDKTREDIERDPEEIMVVLFSGSPGISIQTAVGEKFHRLITVDREDLRQLQPYPAGRALHLAVETIPGYAMMAEPQGKAPDDLRHEHREATLPGELDKLNDIPWGLVRRVIDQRGSLLYLTIKEQRTYLTWLIGALKSNSGAVLDLAKGLSRCLGINARICFADGQVAIEDLQTTYPFEGSAHSLSESLGLEEHFASFVNMPDYRLYFMSHIMTTALDAVLSAHGNEFTDYSSPGIYRHTMEPQTCILEEPREKNKDLNEERMISIIAGIISMELYGDAGEFLPCNETLSVTEDMSVAERELLNQFFEKKIMIISAIQLQLGRDNVSNYLQAINQPGLVRINKIKELFLDQQN